MFISKDIQLEKVLEAMIEQYVHEIGEETAKECPIMQGMMNRPMVDENESRRKMMKRK